MLDVFQIDGTLLSLGDDSTQEVPLGFTFPYQGQNWTSVWVNSNGNLTFGTANDPVILIINGDFETGVDAFAVGSS